MYEDELLEGLGHWGGEKIDIISKIYDIIRRQENKGEALRFFLESADDIISREDQKVEEQFTKEDMKQLQKQYHQFAKQSLKLLLAQNLDVEGFYEQLWQVIGENILLPSDKEKVYVLYVISNDIRIPYFQMEKGMRMDQEEFSGITWQRRKEIKKALAIVRADFEQRTERSSLLMKILEECGEHERAVVLAHILSGIEQKVLGSIKSILPETIGMEEKS